MSLPWIQRTQKRVDQTASEDEGGFDVRRQEMGLKEHSYRLAVAYDNDKDNVKHRRILLRRCYFPRLISLHSDDRRLLLSFLVFLASLSVWLLTLQPPPQPQPPRHATPQPTKDVDVLRRIARSGVDLLEVLAGVSGRRASDRFKSPGDEVQLRSGPLAEIYEQAIAKQREEIPPLPLIPLSEGDLPNFRRILRIPSSEWRPIPKRIWAFWDGKRSEIPWMIRAMVAGWRWHNPGYNVTVVTAEQVWEIVSVPIPHNFWDSSITRQQRANWMRLAILNEFGGFWIDASTIMTSSLDYILERQRRLRTEAYAFHIEPFTENPQMPVYETYFLATVPTGMWISSWFHEYNLVFANFGCHDDYLDYVRYMHGDNGYRAITQGMNDPSYLKLAVASQRVLTYRNIPLPDTDGATSDPYQLLVDCQYDDWLYAQRLMEPLGGFSSHAHDAHAPGHTGLPRFYKLRRHTRDAIEETLRNRTTPVLKDSIFGRFVVRFAEMEGIEVPTGPVEEQGKGKGKGKEGRK
ncbi:hypothetical protein HDU96_011136 [Phlyctochytrium bullatum]|nr:hypothetical protein HDU96_011136 [Phlyctochytrium bullatum]